MRNGPIDIIDDRSVLWSVVERFDLAKAYLAMLLHAKAGDFYVVAEDDSIPRVVFYEQIAALVKDRRIQKQPRAFFEKRRTAWELETLFGSQPVDAHGIKDKCLWQPREVFSKWIERYAQTIAT